MKKLLALCVMGCLALAGFKKARKNSFPVPDNWPDPRYNFSKNPLSKEKVLLGRALFYDPILSRDSTVSCAGCHSQYTAFTHVDHSLSHGIEGKIGTRNSPALTNLAWHSNFMWDGSVDQLDRQAVFPITHPKEMDENMEHVLLKLERNIRYRKLFYAAYGDDAITQQQTLTAIGQFVLTIVSANARYDSVMRGQAAFTIQEGNGYNIFRQHCAVCHTEPLFTNLQFENNGLSVDTALNDCGRMKVSRQPADSLKFKVPTLRNIEFSSPYMHDGRFKRLSDVIRHYTSGIQQSKTLSPHLRQPIVLTSNEKVDLTAFLLTLTDKNFLFDTSYSYPKYVFQ